MIDGAFRPRGDRNGADVLAFANQVGDYPVFLADLEIFRSESRQFGPAQTARNEQRENRSIAFATETVRGNFAEQGSRLIDRQPVASPDAETLGPFDAADAGARSGLRRPDAS